MGITPLAMSKRKESRRLTKKTYVALRMVIKPFWLSMAQEEIKKQIFFAALTSTWWIEDMVFFHLQSYSNSTRMKIQWTIFKTRKLFYLETNLHQSLGLCFCDLCSFHLWLLTTFALFLGNKWNLRKLVVFCKG